MLNDIGLLVLRVVSGGYMISHGLPKLRDADGEYAKSFESLGFHPGHLFVQRAAVAEMAAGALIALGAFGPLGPMLLLADMIVAATSVTLREKRFKANQHEVEALYAVVAVLIALSGPGKFSADRALGITRFDPVWLRYLSLAAALGGAAVMLGGRNQ